MIDERQVQAGILDYLQRFRHIYCWRQNTGAMRMGDRFVRFGRKGISDILGIMPDGRFLAIEVKRPGGKPTDEQLEFLQAIRDNGGVAFVASSLDDVIAGLTA